MVSGGGHGKMSPKGHANLYWVAQLLADKLLLTLK